MTPDNDWTTALRRVARDFRPLIKAAREQGWRVDATRRHPVLFSPDGRAAVPVPTTPSDHRSLANLRSQLRRAGLEV